MKYFNAALPCFALGFASLLLLSTSETRAFSLNGGSLGLTQRDVRVFNNFTNPEANDNQTPHPQFPGAQGAVMAIWKSAVEWGSMPHGDGTGDPTQPVLGSGGANFDFSFQGEATEVGGIDDNIHSVISGSNGGVLAFTELPISNGWRTRYYDVWTWEDGPGAIAVGYDIQSAATFAHGSALGIAQSSDPNATMRGIITPTSTSLRSIEADDIAAIQTIYGVAGPSKPVINGIVIANGQITVLGSGFDPSGNEVWFTQASAGGDGTPVKVTDLESNGDSVAAMIPANAGPGDVLVRRNGTSFGSLSNAWPTDLMDTGNTCPTPVSYCTAQANSVGPGAQIGSVGLASLSVNGFSLTCTGLPANVPGIFFYGDAQTNTPFGDGTQCVSLTIRRLGVRFADGAGAVSQTLDFASPPLDSGGGAAFPGGTKNFQFWYRDVAGGPSGFNLSDGLSVNFCN